MTNWMWDMVLFGWGFLAGFGVALGAALFVRMYREARHGGEELISQLGPLDTRRFLEVGSK